MSSLLEPFATLEFRASLQLRTPRRVLLRHGEVHGDHGQKPPPIAAAEWQGRWIRRQHTGLHPAGSGYAQHLLDRVSSDAGRVEPRDYLPFLLAVRAIVEAEGSIAERRLALAAELERDEWHGFVARLDGAGEVLDQFFPPFIRTLDIRKATQAGLRRRGLLTPARILAAPDHELLNVSGIGVPTAARCRARCIAAPDPHAEFVDRVER